MARNPDPSNTAPPETRSTGPKRVVGRVVGVFVVSALVPLLIVAAASYIVVRQQVQDLATKRLEDAAKLVGMTLFERLHFLDEDLRLLLRNRSSGDSRTIPLSAGLQGVRRIDRDHPLLTQKAAARLDAGTTVLAQDSSGSGLHLVVPVANNGTRELWSALIDPSWLWEIVDAGRPAGTEVCVIDALGRPLHCSSSTELPTVFSQNDDGSSQSTVGDVTYLNVEWHLFLTAGFDASAWTVRLSEPIDAAFAPLLAYRRALPPAFGAAILFVFLMSNVQIRRRLDPIRVLRDAMQRVAHRDFSEPARVRSADELEDLADAFNEMADRLHDQFATGERLNAALDQAGRRLRDERSRLDAILETAPNCIVSCTEDGDIELVNATTLQLFGYAAEEIVGREIDRLLPCANRFLTLARRGPVVNHSCDGRTKEGETIPLEVSASRVQLPDGNRFTVILRDLTERRQAEAKRSLLERQLRQAQKMETIGTLAGGIAHDFNNILSPILGYVDMALVELPPENLIRSDLERVRAATLRARDLVQQILTFSRQTEREQAPVDVGLIAKEALRLLRASLPSTITIQQRIAHDAVVMADPTQLHQVVMNLCTNAYHAMKKDGGVLTVDVSVESVETIGDDASHSPCGNVCVVVSDTGQGMDSATLDRLYEPFFTTKPVGEGTGLGLSVVHGIVTAHHGSIKVTSTLGEGSTFTIRLPLTHGSQGEAEEPIEALVGGDERIMVVEDDPEVREMQVEFLGRLGYTVLSHSDGRSAWEAFSRDPESIDLIVTDHTMSQMSGLDLAAAVSRERAELPVLLVTGRPDELIGESHPAGVIDILAKPVMVHDLAAAVRSAIDHAQQVETPHVE